MSGHSKWSKIKHKKGVIDAKRGAIFTKLGNAITIAAREGSGDPEMNFSLRLAIDKAKQSNLPKENIERAIKRGTGELGGARLEEIIYEGFLQNKIPIIIQVLTDNKNRAVAEIKQILEKSGGAISGPGAVAWRFNKLGVIKIEEFDKNEFEKIELKLIESGAEDIKISDKKILVYTKPENLQLVKENLEKENVKINSAEIEFVPKEKIKILDEVEEKIQKIFNQLDENQDVVNYYTNLA